MAAEPAGAPEGGLLTGRPPGRLAFLAAGPPGLGRAPPAARDPDADFPAPPDAADVPAARAVALPVPDFRVVAACFAPGFLPVVFAEVPFVADFPTAPAPAFLAVPLADVVFLAVPLAAACLAAVCLPAACLAVDFLAAACLAAVFLAADVLAVDFLAVDFLAAALAAAVFLAAVFPAPVFVATVFVATVFVATVFLADDPLAGDCFAAALVDVPFDAFAAAALAGVLAAPERPAVLPALRLDAAADRPPVAFDPRVAVFPVEAAAAKTWTDGRQDTALPTARPNARPTEVTLARACRVAIAVASCADAARFANVSAEG